MDKLSVEDQLIKWELLREVQETFPYTVEGFLLFAQTIISALIPGSPDLNRMQADICAYLLTGHKYRMVQAQRGQAKTTLTAIFAVFTIIHKPSARILIFSQTGKRAKEISSWVIKIFRRMDFLHFMQPDESNGDKASVEAFDIHWCLKGSDKSPSVACCSIEAGAQGARADLIIADDVESLQNSRTTAGRELLEEITKEFESINQHGDIIYLGTPQSVESIYNNLPNRGYDIRIWPGRYPTVDEQPAYGSHLAPILLADIEANPEIQTGYGVTGKQGKPTCPEMFTDEILIEKEQSQGKAKFQLQYMLNTRLSDEGRFPLKLTDLIVTEIGHNEGVVLPIWASGRSQIVEGLPRFGNRNSDKFYSPVKREYDWAPYERTLMYVDPAGGGKNGDEIAYAIIRLIGSYIYLVEIGGVPGGYEEDKLMRIVSKAKQHNCKEVYIEKNFGNGAHASMLRPLFEKDWPVTIEERWETGQKELRIIDVLEPVISSHRLVVPPSVIMDDYESTSLYPTETRLTYSLFFQMSHITRDKNCLRHDDRLDALAGAVREIVESIDYDMQAALNRKQAQETKEWLEMMNDPMMRRESVTGIVQKPRSKTNRF